VSGRQIVRTERSEEAFSGSASSCSGAVDTEHAISVDELAATLHEEARSADEVPVVMPKGGGFDPVRHGAFLERREHRELGIAAHDLPGLTLCDDRLLDVVLQLLLVVSQLLLETLRQLSIER
jgi:hypothetical protein